MSRLGVEDACAEDVFAALSTEASGKVSLADLKHALVEDSPEALLWELRCRLFSVGIQPRCTLHAIRKAIDLIEHHPDKIRNAASAEWRIQRSTRHIKRMKQKRRQQSCGARYVATAAAACKGEMSDAAASSEPESSVRTQLDRADWQRLCSSLDLTPFETDALFTVLGGDDVGKVDLRGMFVVLRATVAPDVSLERFVTRLLARYGSLRCAFEAVCAGRPDRMMRWTEFHELAQSLDVNDRNATNLWDVLSAARPDDSWPSTPGFGAPTPAESGGGTEGNAAPTPAHDDPRKAISEDRFEQQLLVWSPGTALDALRDQLCDKFGSLAQSRRMLQRTAHQLQRAGSGCLVFGGPMRPSEATLTTTALETLLEEHGIDCPNTDRIIGAAAVAQDTGVTLDSLFDVLKATQVRQGKSQSFAETVLRDDTFPLWQRLHNVQADLASGARLDERRDLGEPVDIAQAALRAAAASPERGRAPQRVRHNIAGSHAAATAAANAAAQRRAAKINPFTPLYKAVASAVRSVSRRPAHSSIQQGGEALGLCSQDSSPQHFEDEDSEQTFKSFRGNGLHKLVCNRDRGKENSTSKSTLLEESRGNRNSQLLGVNLQQPRQALQPRQA